MADIPTLSFALVVGLILGAIFFGGLWWTVPRGVVSKHPVLWLSISLMVRMSITLAGLYLVGRGHWQRLTICMLGFMIARAIVVRATRPNAPATSRAH